MNPQDEYAIPLRVAGTDGANGYEWPLGPESVALGWPCWTCGRPFVAGDAVKAVDVIAASDADQAKRDADRWHTVFAHLAHKACS